MPGRADDFYDDGVRAGGHSPVDVHCRNEPFRPFHRYGPFLGARLAFYANLPYALAPKPELTASFAYTVTGTGGYS